MVEAVTFTGKRISDMELVASVTGREKIPTGTANDEAVTPDILTDYVVVKGQVVQKPEFDEYKQSVDGQLDTIVGNASASNQSIREALAREVEDRIAGDADLRDGLLDQGYALRGEISAQALALQVLIDEEADARATEYASLIKRGVTLPYNPELSYVIGALVVKDGKIQVWDGNSWSTFIDDAGVNIWSGRTQEQKNLEFVSPEDFGAVGDGNTSDLSALKDASQAQGEASLQSGKVYKFGEGVSSDEFPDFYVGGSGKLKWDSIELGGYSLKIKPLFESMYLTPDSWHRATRNKSATFSREYPPYPPQGSGIPNCYNTVISWRSQLDDPTKSIQQVTAFGANIGVDAQDWLLTDAFGQDSGMFCRLSERNTFLGSETAVWAGAPNREYLIEKEHDWYRNTPPNEWTAENNDMEAHNAGIGMKIYNYTNYPSTHGDVSYNTFIGRDSACHFLRGVANTHTGYGSGGNLFEGSYNAIYGRNSGRNLVFGNNNALFGDASGRKGAEFSNCTMIGSNAGQSHNNGNNATVIGYNAGLNSLSCRNSIIIGAYAGAELENIANKLFIGTANNQKNPLIGGDFTTQRVGIKVPVGSEKADLHILTGSPTASTWTGQGLVVEDSFSSNITQDTGSSGYVNVRFTVNGVVKGGFIYGASADNLQVVSGGATQWRFMPTGELRPNGAGRTLGSSANRIASIFLENNPDVSSDARIKNGVRSLEEREKDCALKIKSQIKLYRIIGSDDQRQDCGVLAQEVITIMGEFGLDWQTYKFVNYADGFYSVNYGSLAMFILASI